MDAPGKVEPAAWAGGAGRAALATAAARSPTACRRPPRVCAALAWTRIQPWSWWRGLLPVLLSPVAFPPPHFSSVSGLSHKHGQIVNWIASAWRAAVGVQGGWEPPAQNGGGLFARPFPQSKQSLRSFQRRVRAIVVRFGIESALGGEPGERDFEWRRRAQPEHGVQEPQGPGEADGSTRTRGAGDPSSSVPLEYRFSVECFRRVNSGGECGAPRGRGGGRHGVRGDSGGVPARGPGVSPDLCPPRAPLAPCFHPPETLQWLVSGG